MKRVLLALGLELLIPDIVCVVTITSRNGETYGLELLIPDIVCVTKNKIRMLPVRECRYRIREGLWTETITSTVVSSASRVVHRDLLQRPCQFPNRVKRAPSRRHSVRDSSLPYQQRPLITSARRVSIQLQPIFPGPDERPLLFHA
ncbi:hypothetical protein EVAR_25063_1 [Eumeta japonica]|uniref:Secreted protein n=1 Tax=Eumeta variegata TaxID=151549 RepID=A0A4C1V729_EUMVA|nr:hypothetical protein EVAR_25063_1 [Eumeta japonica]